MVEPSWDPKPGGGAALDRHPKRPHSVPKAGVPRVGGKQPDTRRWRAVVSSIPSAVPWPRPPFEAMPIFHPQCHVCARIVPQALIQVVAPFNFRAIQGAIKDRWSKYVGMHDQLYAHQEAIAALKVPPAISDLNRCFSGFRCCGL